MAEATRTRRLTGAEALRESMLRARMLKGSVSPTMALPIAPPPSSDPRLPIAPINAGPAGHVISSEVSEPSKSSTTAPMMPNTGFSTTPVNVSTIYPRPDPRRDVRPARAPVADLFSQPSQSRKSPVQPARAKPKVDVPARVLKALDLTSLQHMLLCVPSSYSDCRLPITSLHRLEDGFTGLFWLRRTGLMKAVDAEKREVHAHPYSSILEAPYQGYWSSIRQLQIELIDEHGTTIWLSVFNPWKMRDRDPLGHMLIEGELQQFGPKRFITGTSEPPQDVAGKVWVRYVRPGAPAEADVRALVQQAFDDPDSFDAAIHSLVSSSLLSEQQLLDLAEAACGQHYENLREFFMDLHAPESPDDGLLAAESARLMAVAGICNAAKAANFRHPHAKAALHLSQSSVQSLIDSQPETLTDDQLVVVQSVVAALRAPQPLNGLISGDVGTGKSLAFMLPAVCAHQAGALVAIVSPTEILANQVAANLMRRFPQARIERVLAGGKIKDPMAILVGTSGLGSVARKAGYVPNFLVIDEQHKLATKDRNSMVGPWTHQLEASATPIPRSLAATMFNGTQVFNLIQSPVKRDIESFVLDEAERGRAVSWMRKALDDGHRVAVIYPRVEKMVANSPDDMKPVNATDAPAVVNSVNAAAEALEVRYPGRVGKLHGKLSSEEVAQTLQNFRTGIQPLVVASTIMETGIDIPDIRLLIVKDADNFGIAQLHQLRGRLARNGGSARFVMMVNDRVALSPETAQRLETLRTTTDGYALAEADMETRGFGDMAGNAQSGNSACAFRLLKLTLADFQV